ncbi:MAG: DUF983 domain-containing protein [Alphaproteobacteria bacterium]
MAGILAPSGAVSQAVLDRAAHRAYRCAAQRQGSLARIGAIMRWEPDRTPPALPYQPPSARDGLLRGLKGLCPVCGQGRLFAGYLRVADKCESCGAPTGRLRADDAPPYFTILITGHVLVPPVWWIERAYMPPIWLHMLIWLPLFTIICTLLLRPIKGAVIGWMMRLGMTGDEGGVVLRGGKPDA